jgi:endonuclease YncB( thermonuclease family)
VSAAVARRIGVGAAALLVLLAVGWAAALWLRPATHAERYAVIDGDTLAVWPDHCFLSHLGIGCLAQRLRLYGVDAFEGTQTCRDAKGTLWRCGAVATQRLRQLVTQANFACHVDPEFVDRHAREFAVCTAGDRDVGAVATQRLRQLVTQANFACHVDPEFVDRHAREFAVCTAGDRDVGALLVSEGLAFAYGRGEQYLGVESEAKARARGAWAGHFVRPQFFRQGATE